jgi:hypothetical protein
MKPIIFLFLILLIGGCNNVNLGDVPYVFDINDFRQLKAGQSFVVPQDGVYFSDYAARRWIRAKIYEYNLNKDGFGEKDNK